MNDEVQLSLSVAFYKGKGIISKAVEKMTDSVYSHTALILTISCNNNTSLRCVYDINWDRKFGMHKLSWKTDEYDEIPLKITEEELSKVLQFFNIYVDRISYDFMVNLQYLLKRLKIKISVRGSKNRWNCVEAANSLLSYIGIFLDMREDSMTPITLHDQLITYLENHPDKTANIIRVEKITQ